VSVNGHPIPFDMKIGEAGEAFFVLETEDDVPDDLITSPVLKPTTPDEPSEASNSVTPGRFGAKEEKPTPDEEPDYFDLDARPSSEQIAASSSQDHPITPSPTPPFSQAQDTTARKSDVNPLPSPPPSPGKETAQDEVDRRADAALKRTTGKDIPVPSVEYRSGMSSRNDSNRKVLTCNHQT
jgi:phosphatidate phosphatase LPIN